jgi:hypothetical protein
MNFASMDFNFKSVVVLASTVARTEDILPSKIFLRLSMAVILPEILVENFCIVEKLVPVGVLVNYWYNQRTPNMTSYSTKYDSKATP